MSDEEAFISIGMILKPVGLQGEVKVALLTDFPERFDGLDEVMVLNNVQERFKLKISKVRHGVSFVYLSFVGLTSVREVDVLRGGLLQVPESERIVLPEGSYFHSDLIGMEVHTHSGVFLGTISDILETGSNDIFVVNGEKGEFLVPMIEKFVKKVDLKQNRICIDPIEGLLEL